MRKIALLALAAALAAPPAHAGGFPPEMVYHFYLAGHYAGKCVVKSGEKGDTYTFDSRTEVQTPQYSQVLESYSEFSKETLAPVYYSYRGTKADAEISGAINFTATKAKGDISINGDSFPSELPITDKTMLFENYVVEHQGVMLARLERSSEPFTRFSLFFASDFTAAPCVGTVDSEVELPLKPKPAVCRKYSISIQNSDTFYGYFDPDRHAVVYMDYPGSSVEIFLLSAWGENPPVKYKSAPAAEPAQN